MPQYSFEERASRISLSWRFYLDMENEIIDFLNYVPLVESHLEVFSPKLVTIILQAGPEIINAFNLSIGNLRQRAAIEDWFEGSELSTDLDEIWRIEADLRNNNRSLSFKRYYDFLEKHGLPKISKAEIQLRENASFVLNPFIEENPNWWDIYNSLKHDKYDSLSRATLFETLICLGGLYWLLDSCAEDLHVDDRIISKVFLRIRQ
ncbi:hypothetical protein MUP77_01160 [Candidatus Bathyarchaeota archaeon]|nr:hypothetical protein [Candidatus Bathyarchaeota archaeon]